MVKQILASALFVLGLASTAQAQVDVRVGLPLPGGGYIQAGTSQPYYPVAVPAYPVYQQPCYQQPVYQQPVYQQQVYRQVRYNQVPVYTTRAYCPPPRYVRHHHRHGRRY